MHSILVAVNNIARLRKSYTLLSLIIILSSSATLWAASASLGADAATRHRISTLTDIKQVKIFSAPFGTSRNAILSSDTIIAVSEIPGVNQVLGADEVYGLIEYRMLISFPNQIIGIDLDNISSLGYQVSKGTANLARGSIILGSEISHHFIPKARLASPYQTIAFLDSGTSRDSVLIRLAKSDENGQEVTQAFPFRVVGILEQTGSNIDNSAFISISDSTMLRKWQEGSSFSRRARGYGLLIAIVEDVSQVSTVHAFLSDSGYLISSRISDAESGEQINASTRMTAIITSSVTIGISIVGTFLFMRFMVNERKREIGLMKAIGVPNSIVRTIFLAESTLIGLIGGLLGVFLGFVLQAATPIIVERNSVLGIFSFLSEIGTDVIFQTPVWLLVIIIGIVTLFSLLGGILPAISASNLDPVTALRDL